MTPPTVAPGSVVVMRRHDTSPDAVPNSFCVSSPTKHHHQGHMSSQQDNHGENKKQKKSWGDRLKLGKSERSREQPSYGVSTSPDNLLQEYRDKYGTLSSGSALSKSMKYAETWLYGSVAVRSPPDGSTPSRPSLFLYHPPPTVAVIPTAQAVVIPPGTKYAVVMCSCPEFLSGTARSKKSQQVVCKKCGGSRVLWNVSKGGGTVRASGGSAMIAGGTVRAIGGTLRLGGGNNGPSRVRPSLLNLSPVPQATQNPNSSPQTTKPVTPDPYDLMRRNRLGAVNNNEGPLKFGAQGTVRVRAKSTSPCRSGRRSPSPPVNKRTLVHARSEKSRLGSERDFPWEREFSNWNSVAEASDATKRKSILECDVNAYDLIAKYLKSSSRSEVNDDPRSRVDGFCTSKSGDVPSDDDDVLDDELSDNLSDNALENSSEGVSDVTGHRSQKTRKQNRVSCHSKADVQSRLQDMKDLNSATVQPPCRKTCVEKLQNASTSTSLMSSGITLGGQRIRIFNEPTLHSLPEGNGNVASDGTSPSEFSRLNDMPSGNSKVEAGTSRQQDRSAKNASLSPSQIPRLTSPLRPPRKTKTSSESPSDCSNNGEAVIKEVEEVEEGNENESPAVSCTERAGSSLSQVKDVRSSSSTEGVCIIKSILKKPSTLSPGEISASFKTFSDTVSKPDYTTSSPAVVPASSDQHNLPSPVVPSSGSNDFYLPTFQEYKQQYRRKKQVQFKVLNDVALLKPVEEEQESDLHSSVAATSATAATVRHCIAGSTGTVSDSPPVGEEAGDAAVLKTLLLVKTDTSIRGDRLETGFVEQERINEDFRLVEKKEEKLGVDEEEFEVSSDAREEDKTPIRDKEKLKGVVSNSIRSGDIKNENGADRVASVKLQYFGGGDVGVVNRRNEGGDHIALPSGEDSGAGDDRGTTGDTEAVLGGSDESTATQSDLLRQHRSEGEAAVVSLRRSQSERLLPTDSDDPDRRQTELPAAGSAVLFNDTMRLRLRQGRPDIRQVFSDAVASGTDTSSGSLVDIPNRPKRMLSPGRPRPKEPPPPPPPLSPSVIHDISQNSLPELPPRQIFPFTKKQMEQMNQQARQFSIKSNSKQHISSSASRVKKSCDLEQTTSSSIRAVSWSPLMNQDANCSCATVSHMKKKREHRHSDPGPDAPKLVVHIENSTEEHCKETEIETTIESPTRMSCEPDEKKQDSVNCPVRDMSRTGNCDDSIGRTIVTISSPGSPFLDVHRLQIKEEDPARNVSPGPGRRTSILITSEDSVEATKHMGNNTHLNSSVTTVMIQNANITASPVTKDASNKVTISVGGISDHLPLEVNYQKTANTNLSSSCTIVDTSPSSTLDSRKTYNNNNFSTFSLLSSKEINVIPVSPEEQVQRTLLVVDHRDEVASDDTVLRCWNTDSAVPVKSDDDIRVITETVTLSSNVEDCVREATSSAMSAPKSRGVDLSTVLSPAAENMDILLNPVEAVKRNLVPHVCGKKDLTPENESTVATSSPSERLDKLVEANNDNDDNEREALKEGDYLVTAAESKLRNLISNDDGPLYSNVSSAVSKISEDILPTVIEQEEEGDSDVCHAQEPSWTEVEDCPKTFSNLDVEDGRTDGRSLDVESSDTNHYSIISENEGTGSRDEGDDTTSASRISESEPFKDSVSVETDKSYQADEEEIQDNKNGYCGEPDNELDDENIYDSIKDPIYEEIPDTPPPLPLSPPPSLDELEEINRVSRSIFEGASKYDILSYLVGAKERGIVPEETYYSESANGDEIIEILDGKTVHDEEEGVVSHQRMTSLDLGDLSSRVSHLSNASDSSEDSCNIIISSIGEPPSSPNKVRKSSAEIERNDSGVGSETSKSSRSRWQHCGPATNMREDQQLLCEDCDQPVETQVTDSGVMFAPLVCRKCAKKRAERKEIIAEIVETEEKYGRDLQIIMEEFYRPMLVAGLLTPEHLAAIFLNVEELLEHNIALAEKLRDAMEIAQEQGDEDLLTVNIGKLFLEASPMLHAFESYCIRQGAASLLLANLEKEKELLRIFLRVSQMENAVLRRMNLNSFLMVPVQRVTKYPLLLARLYKVTPPHHESRELLRQSQQKIELHLEHMNSEAKDISTTKLWRRISIMNGRRVSSETDMLSIKLRKLALDILEWNHDEVRFAMEGKLLYTNPTDNNWRKGRTIKLNPINALLVTNGKPTDDYRPDPSEDELMFPRKTGVREATLLLLKEKCGRYMQLREPLYLDKCIVCSEADWEGYFEVQELASKDTYIFKADGGDQTKLWYRQLQYHAQGMGAWRRRRNALANIMINGMQTRS